MKHPLVTIIMATYNRQDYILESLLAIKAQTYTYWECLIIDDGGSDNTKAVINDLLFEDDRFVYMQRTKDYKKGLPGCRNYGLELSKGDYVIFFDDDDIPHPLNLELCIEQLVNSNFSFCSYKREVFKKEFDYKFDYSREFSKSYIEKKDVLKLFNHELSLNSCAVMWRKNCFTNNRFIEHLMYAEEWELYTRIISQGFDGIAIDKTLFYGRKHDNSNTGEFHLNNPERLKSHANAIKLIVLNLQKEGLLTNRIMKHFIQISRKYESFELFITTINDLELSNVSIFKWKIFNTFLPFKIYLSKLKKKINKYKVS